MLMVLIYIIITAGAKVEDQFKRMMWVIQMLIMFMVLPKNGSRGYISRVWNYLRLVKINISIVIFIIILLQVFPFYLTMWCGNQLMKMV